MRSTAIIIILAALGGLFGGAPAFASCTGGVCTDTFTYSIGFDTAITLSKNADIDFGTVYLAPCTYRVATDGTASAVSATPCALLAGSTSAASITIKGSVTEVVGVSITGETADRGVSIASGTETCSYNGGSSGSCTINGAAAPTSAGKTLTIGVDVTADGTQAVGTTYSPSFTVNVVYQ